MSFGARSGLRETGNQLVVKLAETLHVPAGNHDIFLGGVVSLFVCLALINYKYWEERRSKKDPKYVIASWLNKYYQRGVMFFGVFGTALLIMSYAFPKL